MMNLKRDELELLKIWNKMIENYDSIYKRIINIKKEA